VVGLGVVGRLGMVSFRRRRRRMVGGRSRFVESWCWLVVGRDVRDWSWTIYWSWGMVSRGWGVVWSRGVDSMNSVVRSVVEADTNTGHLTVADYSLVTLVR